ncbi:MAG: MFS transporter [Dehalococcoidia bacterium]|nr:MFS transporter [Dehalococcoidia bacterium]
MSAPVATEGGALRRLRGVYYGWWLLAASVVAMAFGSGFSFWSFGLYVSPLEEEFGWSRAQVSLGFSFALLVSGLVSPLVGRWIDVRGPRSAIVIGATLASLTYVLLALTETLWQWYLFNAINAVFRQMMFFIPFQTLVSRWFVMRRGVALSILGVGFSLGGFAVVPLMQAVVDTIGWDGSFLFSGAMTALIFLPVAIFVIKNRPEDIGAQPDGRTEPLAPGHVNAGRSGVSLSEAVRMPLFWLIALGLMLLFYGMFGWTVHQIPFWESKGFSRETGALFLSLAAGAGIIFRLSFGFASDRLPRIEYAGMAFTACLLTSFTILLLSTSVPGIGLYLAFWVVGSSGAPLMEALLITRAFGLAHFATILGTIVVIETIGQIISPTVAGAIFDATGSYDWALVMFICTFSASFGMFLLASKLPQPAARASQDQAPG